MNVAFQDAVEKCPETGLVAVKTGADVGDDFRATGLLESFCLPKQIFFLALVALKYFILSSIKIASLISKWDLSVNSSGLMM